MSPYIGGKITDARGAMLSGIYVIAYRSNSGELLFAGLTLSDASGQYVLSELPAATYRISFHDPTSTYISEWYMDAADLAQAQDVSLVADQVADAIDATLEPAVDDRKQQQPLLADDPGGLAVSWLSWILECRRESTGFAASIRTLI